MTADRGLDTEARDPKYARVEFERRWLVDASARPPLDGLSFTLIEDRYIEGTRLRLRRMARGARTVLKLTKKYEDEALKNKIELDLARLQAEQASELFRQRTILAPINGVLVERMREVGETVTATQPMFRLVEIDQVFVQFYLPSDHQRRLKVGDVGTRTSPAADVEDPETQPESNEPPLPARAIPSLARPAPA